MHFTFHNALRQEEGKPLNHFIREMIQVRRLELTLPHHTIFKYFPHKNEICSPMSSYLLFTTTHKTEFYVLILVSLLKR